MSPGQDQGPAKGPKDCRVCNRRRIKCDRGLPTCQKCNDRDLKCPGYSVPLKWIQGVASRGKAKGKGFPVPGAPQEITFVSGNVANSGDSSDSTPEDISDDVEEVVPRETSVQKSPAYDMDQIISLAPPQASEFLNQPLVRRLLHHFNHDVARRLAWVDSSDNPWRNIILPMALESPSLMFSVLALSAGDISFKAPSGTSLSSQSLSVSTQYRDKALELLALQLKSETQGSDNNSLQTVDQKPANKVLATTLMLFNLEILQPGSAHWRLHLWAARTMIRRWGNTIHLPAPIDTTSTFLLQEFFVPNVCAFITTFADTHDVARDTLIHDNDSVFVDFHRVLQEVTNLERRLAGQRGSAEDLMSFIQRLEEARERTLSLGQELKFWSPKTRSEFAHVVEMFYHMGLIYSRRAVLGGSAPNANTWASRDRIFELTRSLKETNAFIQDLVLPLFLAGTECRGCANEQLFVESKFLEIIRATGPLDRWQILSFLKAFWSLEGNFSLSWIDFARARAQQGNSFMIY
ncbi:hypothetical protein BP5796_08316 [Coleophoma crateriformis]|uniref:Zn(2)-C6 fungal-type domain-containing protein n=1 Tax=Coleophoma crateriformis TaxID=565419 RepID=A0A3D8R7A0_9HELO|nr:hypothetical protein BP5796_08316 [Coleophoma crateriformis]